MSAFHPIAGIQVQCEPQSADSLKCAKSRPSANDPLAHTKLSCKLVEWIAS